MSRTFLRPALAAVALSAALFAAPSFAAVVNYSADLKASSEVPPNDSKGKGTVTAKYDTDTKKFNFSITYSGLSGPATAAHFHGPADATANAAPVVPIPATMLASPINAETTLTDAQAADLAAGKWYFNVHTAANKGGEIRGQMMKK
jgi:hypothetical protein